LGEFDFEVLGDLRDIYLQNGLNLIFKLWLF